MSALLLLLRNVQGIMHAVSITDMRFARVKTDRKVSTNTAKNTSVHTAHLLLHMQQRGA